MCLCLVDRKKKKNHRFDGGDGMNTYYIADLMCWLDQKFPISDPSKYHSMSIQNDQLVLLIWHPIDTKYGKIMKQWQVVVEDFVDKYDGRYLDMVMEYRVNHIERELEGQAAHLVI